MGRVKWIRDQKEKSLDKSAFKRQTRKRKA